MKRLLLTAIILFQICYVNPVPAIEFKIVQLTNNDVDDRHPHIHKNNIVWVSDGDVVLSNGSSTNKITNTEVDERHPKVYNSTVAWETPGEIFYWDGTQTIKMASNAIDLSFHNGQMAWAANGEIYFWDGNYTTRVTYTTTYEHGPSVYENTLAWMSRESGAPEIYYWNGDSTIQVSNPEITYNNFHASLYNGTIAWEGMDREGGIFNHDISFWDGVNITQITNNNIDDDRPVLYNEHITWGQFIGSDVEIMFGDGFEVIQITDNNADDALPSMYEDKIVWMGYDGNDYEIFLATPVVPLPPAMLLFFSGILGLLGLRRRLHK